MPFLRETSSWRLPLGIVAALVLVALVFSWGRLYVGFRVYWRSGRGSPRAAMDIRAGPYFRSLPLGSPHPAARTRLVGASARFAVQLAERGRLEQFQADVRFGLGDAAATGVCAGLAQGVLWTLAGAVARGGTARGMRPDIVVRPDFRERPENFVRLHCIWSWTLGQVMAVAAREAADRAIRRVRNAARAIHRRGPRRERASDPGTHAHRDGQPQGHGRRQHRGG